MCYSFSFNLSIIVFKIIFLILLSVLVISISDNPYSQKQANVISNSYNVNSYNTLSQPSSSYGNRVYTTDRNSRYLSYSDYAYQTRKRGILGNNINKYEVHVENQDYKGGYFTVRYYFKDYYG